MISINKVNVQALCKNEIKDIYSAHKNIVKKYKFLDRFENVEKFKKQFIASFNKEKNELFILKRDSSILGIITFIKTADWNKKEEYQLKVLLTETSNEEDLLNEINTFIENKLNELNKIVVITFNNELNELINKFNNKIKLKGNSYTLKREDIDVNLLDKWIKELSAKNKDLKIEYTDTISEKYIKQYCDLFSETMKDMTDRREEAYEDYIITPEIQRQINESFKKNNGTHNCYMIFNSKNEMIAKSNLSVNNKDPRFPYQFMIGAKREYRGRGLGRWLYASMYKRLYENVKFEEVLVVHHPENAAAIKISESVGYKFRYLETSHVLSK